MRSALLSLTVLSTACGVPLLPEGYEGEPIYSIRYVQKSPNDLQLREGDPGHTDFGLFWDPRGLLELGSYDELLEQPANSRSWRKVPQLQTWPLFVAPGPELLFTTPSGAQFGVARPLGYRDRDLNGRRNDGEPIFYVANGLLLYAPAPLSAEDSPVGRALQAGFHMIKTPFPCGGPSQPPNEGQCGVPLGIACAGDPDCGPGVCLTTPRDTDADLSWDGGACGVLEPPPDGCRPQEGVLFRSPAESLPDAWILACDQDADCGRGEDYHCDLAFGGCLPNHFLLDSRLFSTHPPPSPVCLPPLP